MGNNFSLSPEEATARLDQVFGVEFVGSPENKKLAWDAFDQFYRTKFRSRSPIKPMDLTCCVSTLGVVDAELEAALRKALDADEESLVPQLLNAIDSCHLRSLPKLCLGFAGLYRQMGDKQPMKYAHEKGCRQYDIMGAQSRFQGTLPPPMVAEMTHPPSAWKEFDGIDTSDTVFVAYCQIFIKQDQAHTVSSTMVRENFNALRKEMAAVEKERGLPLIDCYVMTPVAAFSMPGFHGHGCFSEFWKEAEKLVDEGLVRSLGMNNATIHQIESLLEFAKHRPVMHTFESHLLNQQSTMVQFCKDHRIAPRAHVSLGKGDVFELPCCKRDDMSPAQAAIKWHLQDDVSACFGVDTLEHIEQNFKVPSLVGLPPVVHDAPGKPLMKLYPMMSMNLPGIFIKTGTREDAGILRKDADGRFWAASSEESGVKWFERLKKMSSGQESLLFELEQVLDGLGKMMGPSERRRVIRAKIATMGKKGTSTTEGGEKDEKQTKEVDKEASAFHQVSGDVAAKGLTEMQVVSLATFREKGAIPRRSVLNPAPVHVPVTALGPKDRVLFFSQRWLTPSPRSAATPDDAEGTKYKQIVASCSAYAELNSIDENNIYIWLDFSSVDQDDDDELIKGVNSLALYVCSSDAFISIDHADYFNRGWCLMECMFADAAKAPRYTLTKDNELKPMDINMRLECKVPAEGSFTVESDREIMKVLESMAVMITMRLDRGITFNGVSEYKEQGSKKLSGDVGGELAGSSKKATTA